MVSGQKVKSKKKKNISKMGKALRGLGGLGGGALGTFLGQGSEGTSIGRNLGGALSQWLGFGDYKVNSNSIVQHLSVNGSVPEMHKSGQSITVRHREFIGDIVSPGAAYNEAMSVRLNPGDIRFPWLRGIAVNFQEYRWKGVVFHYVSTSGNSVGSTNTSLGSVMMSTNYDASKLAPINKVELLNEYYSNDSAPSTSFAHPVECDPALQPAKFGYVTANPNDDHDARRIEDHGWTHVFTQGQQATATLGELWCSYEIELHKPHARAVAGTELISRSSNHTGCNNTHWFGTSFSADSYENDVDATWGSNTVTFKRLCVGTYMFTSAYAGVTAYTIPTITVAGAVSTSLKPVWKGSYASGGNTITAMTSGVYSTSMVFENYTPAGDVTISITSGSGVLTTSSGDSTTYLTQVSGGGWLE